MIGVLDPALLLPCGPDAGAQRLLASELDELLLACRDADIELPMFEEYWPELWRTLGRRLHVLSSDRHLRRAIDELRRRGRPPRDAPLRSWRGRVYGFRQLFADIGEAGDWSDRMVRAVIRAVATSQPTVLLVRRMLGRNVMRHAAGNSTTDESTRWLLQLHVRGAAPTAVPCVHCHRNLQPDLGWTTRFDPRLPSERDGAAYPFCPPSQWWRRDVDAVRTIESRPAWIDRRGFGWARPNIMGGQGHHWDVYISDRKIVERIGLAQLNVVEFGAPCGQGHPGSLHHVPKHKQGRLRDDTGWSCD